MLPRNFKEKQGHLILSHLHMELHGCANRSIERAMCMYIYIYILLVFGRKRHIHIIYIYSVHRHINVDIFIFKYSYTYKNGEYIYNKHLCIHENKYIYIQESM